MQNNIKTIVKLILLIIVVIDISLFYVVPSYSFSDDTMIDDRMLMFVGEDIDIVTVASRTPESPSTAPAVVKVIDHNDIAAYGYKTLAEVLSAQSGFYIADQGLSSIPYMRGISNGILVLYDGVPVPTGGHRSYYPLDYELSLNSIKRIEIIKGPGSVLWGADAFAGIVNIVPFTGKDIAQKNIKSRTYKKSISTSSKKEKDYNLNGRLEAGFGLSNNLKGFADTGLKGKNWDAYLSVYGARNKYENGSPLDASFSEKNQEWISGIDNSEYSEVTANFNFKDSFYLSGRVSDFNKFYTQTVEAAETIEWLTEKEVPASYIKANYSKTLGGSHWNMTTYYQNVSYKQMDAGTSIKEELDIFYGEILWDRRFFKRGLMTAGISYRENHVDGALVDGGFMPEYLVAEYQFFSQPIYQMDYKNNLKSIFSQYRHPFSWCEFWAGFRVDDNSMYEDYAPSYSIGINIPLDDKWRVKTAFGTGYRTPYSQQWTGKELLTRDDISTLNIQAEWNSGQGESFSATAFASRLSDNVQSDPYAGVSEPSDRDFIGIELFGRKKLYDNLDAYTSLSKIFCSGSDYNFSAVGPSYLRPDGTKVDTYENWSQSYDLGADFIVNGGLAWHINHKIDFSLTGLWTSPIPYSYNQNKITGEYDNPLLLNSEIRVKNFFYENLIFSAGCKNILDGDFTYYGYYGAVKGNPLTSYFSLKYSF